ncbi:lipoyl(octanoyl) transferase LipB [Arthrobacter sp. zg-Y877]|uniref:lipoyl(octanoyl) transferase LipB n=1 Tax=Arthrobacter sp. zg-Y877 TaxID=3049074 RepID=UPI0025A41D49|nr:lipoyl(octanoyl) transferase LipB [Arthrobacter sp. zg-Y877]MDM7988941.1 lipoyl(octanoyl) transferase LipB [Arthrobacter sp. zg-Y877]
MALEFTRVGLAPHYVDYSAGWDLQQQLHRQVLEGRTPNTVLLLEHTSVYTAGRRTEPHERPFDGTPVINVDRGGKLTWHGPGQLVGYPIVKLADPSSIKAYVAVLEAAVISVLQGYGIAGVRVEGRSGVWVRGDGKPFGVPDRKIAAVGIRVHQGVTMHGFSLNCSNDPAPYSQIVACGITDAGTTSISAETGEAVSPADVVGQVEAALAARESDMTGTIPPKTPSGAGAIPAASRPKGALL